MNDSPNFIDITNLRFGRWLVISRVKASKFGMVKWNCLCNCGNKKVVFGMSLRNGDSKSCGCLQKELQSKRFNQLMFKHGFTKNDEIYNFYRSHQDMKQRCYNKNTSSYKNYGGRGISVCERWLGKNGFINFKEDMFLTWRKGLSLDRKNNNLNYSPENCKWSTQKEQVNNQRRNRSIKFNGKIQNISQWANEFNMNYAVLYQRLFRGWTMEKALTFPLKKYGQRKYQRVNI